MIRLPVPVTANDQIYNSIFRRMRQWPDRRIVALLQVDLHAIGSNAFIKTLTWFYSPLYVHA